MTGFCRKTICLFIAMLFIFSLSIPAFAVSGRTTVYRTKTGDHYHTSDCRFLGKSKIKTTLDAAVNEYHLTPCSICNPPSFESEAEIAAEPVEPDLNKTTRPANGEVLYSKNKTRPSTLTRLPRHNGKRFQHGSVAVLRAQSQGCNSRYPDRQALPPDRLRLHLEEPH